MTTPARSAEILLEAIDARRSAGTLGEPGPTRDQLDRILGAANTAPDHGRLRPYRFVVIAGEGRARFGDALAAVAAERKPGMAPDKLEGTRAKAFRSPTIIALIASPKPGKIEIWEQHATAACAGFAITLAAHAVGVGAVWKSVAFTRGRALTELFGLAEAEEMLGWIHLGTEARPETAPRPPLDLAAVATILDGAETRPYR